MYQLPSYVDVNVKLDPAAIMYSLPSYHTFDIAEQDNEIVENDPCTIIELKQANLLSKLIALNVKLDCYLKSEAVKNAGGNAQKDSAKIEQKISQINSSTDSGKKEKDAKKEARKAAKNEAKNKASNGTSQEIGKQPKNVLSSWVVAEDKPSTETGQSLTSCTEQKLMSLSQENYGHVKLSVQKRDFPWVEAFSKIGKFRNVAFTGVFPNNAEKAATTISVEEGDFCLAMKNLKITRRITTWKMLGSALGIYSFTPQQSINATHQQMWLEKSEEVINRQLEVCNVIREVSKFLSSFDGLGAQFSFGVADIVVRSLLPAGQFPSNVELWILRIDGI